MKLPQHIGWPRVVRVSGPSMEPTLFDRDLLLLSRIKRPVASGDLLVAHLPGGRGLGVKRAGQGPADDAVIAAGGVWLERDNPALGSDSWTFGAVLRDDVTGRVVARLWPRPRRF